MDVLTLDLTLTAHVHVSTDLVHTLQEQWNRHSTAGVSHAPPSRRHHHFSLSPCGREKGRSVKKRSAVAVLWRSCLAELVQILPQRSLCTRSTPLLQESEKCHDIVQSCLSLPVSHRMRQARVGAERSPAVTQLALHRDVAYGRRCQRARGVGVGGCVARVISPRLCSSLLLLPVETRRLRLR